MQIYIIKNVKYKIIIIVIKNNYLVFCIILRFKSSAFFHKRKHSRYV